MTDPAPNTVIALSSNTTATDVEVGSPPAVQKPTDPSLRTCRAGRALILLHRIQDNRSLVVDGKLFQYFVNRGWNRAEVQRAVDDLSASGAIRINADSPSTLMLEATA